MVRHHGTEVELMAADVDVPLLPPDGSFEGLVPLTVQGLQLPWGTVRAASPTCCETPTRARSSVRTTKSPPSALDAGEHQLQASIG
jgi:hypothetical protein